MADEQASNNVNSIELATELTAAWLNNPNVRAAAEDVPAFLKSIHATINELSRVSATAPISTSPEYIPAVPVRSSVKPDYIVSLIDGKRLKSLKRHLSSHGLTPAEYRERYGLKPDYPMVSEKYSAERRAVAKNLGLGRKGRGKRATVAAESASGVPTAAADTSPAGRKPKAASPRKAASKRTRATVPAG